MYNLVPPPGVPAEFGFNALGTSILIDAVVRSGGNYGITGRIHDLSYYPVYQHNHALGCAGRSEP